MVEYLNFQLSKYDFHSENINKIQSVRIGESLIKVFAILIAARKPKLANTQTQTEQGKRYPLIVLYTISYAVFFSVLDRKKIFA
jgi:hypothetical protein